MADEDNRKSLTQLIEDNNRHRKMLGKVYIHKKSRERYNLLMFCFREHDNELMAVYGVTAYPAIKFVRPAEEFIDRFEVEETYVPVQSD